MKIAIIGANGRLGSRVTKIALDNGNTVDAYVVNDNPVDKRAKVVKRDIFSLSRLDVEQYDALISCFGSGFDADPIINKNVVLKMIELFKNTNKKVIHIIGSGSLFADSTHTNRVYELPSHPDFLRGISRCASEGLVAFQNENDVDWTVVMPSLEFSDDTLGTGDVQVSFDLVPQVNSNGKSFVTYNDLALVMIDALTNKEYSKKAITVLSK